MIRLNQEIIGIVFSEVDVRLVDCVFSPKGDYSVRQWAKISRLEKNDVALAMDLKRTLSEKKILQKNVAITLPDSNFLLKTLTLPKIDRKDIKKYLEREVSKDLNLPHNECLYDFFVSNEREVSGLKKIDLGVLAAPKEIILRYAGIVMEAGLVPALIGPSSMAMFHLMTLDRPPVTQAIALIYLGANQTTITIAERGHVVFTRRLNLSLFSGNTADGSDASLSGAVFDDVVREIKRTLLYCKKEVIDQEVVQLITAAAVPLSDTQLTLLREKLNVEVLPWRLKPQASTNEEADSTEKMSEGYLFALGAGACAARGTRLQLLPWSLKWKSYEGRVLQLASVLLLFFFFGGLWSYVVQEERLGELTVLAVEREARIGEADLARKAEERRIAARYDLETRQAILTRLRKRRPDFQLIFQALSRGMPEDARFDSVVISRKREQWIASLNGRTFWKENIEQVEVFAQLAANLQHSGQFSELAFNPVESRPESEGEGMPFQLRIQIQ